MRRGDVYDAVLDPTTGSEQGGRRPVLIVTRNAINDSSPVVIVAPLTNRSHKRRLYPSHVPLLPPDGGTLVESVVLCEQMRAIDKSRLVALRGSIAPTTMETVDRALRITLALDE